jgi:hypothetical protein
MLLAPIGYVSHMNGGKIRNINTADKFFENISENVGSRLGLQPARS